MRIAELQRNLANKAANAVSGPCEDLHGLFRHPAWLLQAIQNVIARNPLKMLGQKPAVVAEGLLGPLAQALRARDLAPLAVPGRLPALRDRVIREALRMIWEPIFRGWCEKHHTAENRCFYRAAEARHSLSAHLREGGWWAVGVTLAESAAGRQDWGRCLAPLVRDKAFMALSQAFLIDSPEQALDFVREACSAMQLQAVVAACQRPPPPGISLQWWLSGTALVLLTDGPKVFAEEMQGRLKEELGRFALKDAVPGVWQRHVDDGFEIFGCHFQRKGARKQLQVRLAETQLQAFKAKVVALTHKSTIGEDPAEKIQALNALIRAWGLAYRGNMGRVVSSHLGRFVHERMYRWLKAKHANVSAKVSTEKFVASGYLRPRRGRRVWSAKGISLLSFEKMREYAR